MAQNPFDQASRYAAKLDPAGLLNWLFPPGNLPPFRGWLDTRTLPFPGDPERTCDTVAWLEAGNEPWAVAIEFNLAADPAMFGRLLVYLGQLWLERRPADGLVGRFQVGAVVINLTGRGSASRTMNLGPVQTSLQVIEKNLTDEDAGQLLDGVAAGRLARCVLPWVPLLRGGDDPAIMTQWKELAGAEPDSTRRADYGGLALVFADAADRRPIWKEALKEWIMIQSQQVQEWKAEGKAEGIAEGKAEGKAEGRAEMLLLLLKKKFPPPLPPELAALIQKTRDQDTLAGWLQAALDAGNLEEFRKALELPDNGRQSKS